MKTSVDSYSKGRLFRSKRGTILLAAAAIMSISACSPSNEQGAGAGMQMPPPAVTVAEVINRTVTDGQSHVGRTSALKKVSLSARVQGLLQQRNFVEGSEVVAGQLLFLLEPDQYQANRAVTAASLANAEAVYEQARKYRARLDKVAAGGVSASAIEEADNNLAIAAAKLAQAKAELRLRDLELGYTQITAPISGRIGVSAFDEGNLVGPESGVLAEITQLDPIYVNFSVSERVATGFAEQRIKDGLEQPDKSWFIPRLELSTGTIYPLDGEMDFVASEINQATGSLELRARFPNPHGTLRPGQYVTVKVQFGAAKEMPVVPQSSVQQDQAGYYVIVTTADNTAVQRRVKLGDRVGTDWVVEDGLAAGELVIFDGLQKVQPGVKVSPTLIDPRAALQEQ